MDIVISGVCLTLLFILLKSVIGYLKNKTALNLDKPREQSNFKNMSKQKPKSNIYQGKNCKTKFFSDKKHNRNNPKSSSKDDSTKIASISHKNTTGSDNWKTFLGLVNHTDNQNMKSNPTTKPSQKRSEKTSFSRVSCEPMSNMCGISQENSETATVGFKKRKPFKIRGTDQSSVVKNKKQQSDSPINRKIDLTSSNSTQSVYTPEEDLIDRRKLASVSHRPIVFSGQPKLTKQIAIDCEMVGVEVGVNNDMLARVSLVNYEGDCVYDKFVKPTEHVIDYRTRVSGVRPMDLENATDFEIVQREVSDIIKGRVLVGHALKNDLKVLFLTHPKYMTRDSSRFRKFREGRTPALKNLAKKYLGVEIQDGEHSSIQDALAAMQLYRMFRKEWELSIKTRKPYGSLGIKQNQPTTDL